MASAQTSLVPNHGRLCCIGLYLHFQGHSTFCLNLILDSPVWVIVWAIMAFLRMKIQEVRDILMVVPQEVRDLIFFGL